MKRILLLTFAFSIVLFGFSQQRAIAPKELRNHAVKMVKPTTETMNFSNETLPSATPVIGTRRSRFMETLFRPAIEFQQPIQAVFCL